MANNEDLERFCRLDEITWNAWMVNNLGRNPDLSSATLTGMDFRGRKIVRTNLAGSNLNETNFSGANLAFSDLANTSLIAATLDLASLHGADLRSASLTGASLGNAVLRDADLRGADLSSARMVAVDMAGARIDRFTTLRNVRFDRTHDVMNDGSDSLVMSWFDRYVNWAKLRFVSALPLFGISYAGFGLLFVLVYGVHAVNVYGLNPVRSGLIDVAGRLAEIQPRLDVIRSQHPRADGYFHGQLDALSESLNGIEAAVAALSSSLPGRIPLPEEIYWAFISTITLAIGSTLYKIECPDSVQNFDEVQWVAQLKQPRLLYISDSLGCNLGRWRQMAGQLWSVR